MTIPEQNESGFFPLQVGAMQVPRHCPHRAGRLDHGHINRQRLTLTCPLHQSVFCLRTGKQLAGPACGSLALEWERSSAEMQGPLAAMPDS